MMQPTAAPEPTPASRDSSELTFRAIGAGCLIGILLALSNIYMGLKTGWSDSGNITASILGFALFSALRGLTKRPYSLAENNITQTVATSIGAMAIAGLITTYPALQMLGHSYPGWEIAVWTVAVGFLGVVVAALARHRLLDALPFPTGVVTAELLRTMHKAGEKGIEQAKLLLASAGGAAVFTWFRDGKPSLIPQATLVPGKLGGLSAASLGLGIAWSPMLFGAGLLIGGHLGVSLLLGAGVSWMGLAPALLGAGIVKSADYQTVVAWLLWPAVALMVSASFTGLALGWRSYRSGAGTSGRKLESTGLDRRLVAVLCLIAALVAAFFGWYVFGVSPWIILLSLASSVLLARMAAQAVGETDIDPIGTNAQITQIGFAAVAPGQVVPNLVAATALQGIETQTSMTIWNLKTASVLGVSPRRLLGAEVIGVVVGAAVAVPAYLLVARAYKIGSALLPAPGALSAKAVAVALAGGGAALPAHAIGAMAVAMLVGAALTLLEKTRVRRWVPSPMALAVGFLVPAFYSVIIAAGGIAGELLKKWRPVWMQDRLPSIASGLIAGESIVGVLVAALMVLGVLK